MDGRDAIQRTFVFNNFNEAWGFMNRTALEAEKVQKYPSFFLSTFRLTHNARRITTQNGLMYIIAWR